MTRAMTEACDSPPAHPPTTPYRIKKIFKSIGGKSIQTTNRADYIKNIYIYPWTAINDRIHKKVIMPASTRP